MKLKIFTQLTFMLIALLYLSCETSSDPLPSKSSTKKIVEMELEIIPHTEVPAVSVWDSTYYQLGNGPASCVVDTFRANALAESLKKYAPPVTDFWYPQDDCICFRPAILTSEFIVKLEHPDTSLTQLGFRPADYFIISCYQRWRHYKYVIKEIED